MKKLNMLFLLVFLLSVNVKGNITFPVDKPVFYLDNSSILDASISPVTGNPVYGMPDTKSCWTIATNPANDIVCSGGQSIMNVTLSGGTSPVSYQWQSTTTSCSGAYSNISGATGATFSTPPLNSTTYYVCVITQSEGGCPVLTSSCGVVTVVPDPVIVLQPTNATICNGGTDTLAVSVSGGTGTFSYQWQSNTTGCNGMWANINGATGETYFTPALTTTTYYHCIIAQTGSGCNTLTSNCGIATVIADPIINIQPTGTTICNGGTATMNVLATGGTGLFTYQWQSSNISCSSGMANIAGATGATYNTPALTDSTYYNCVISQSGIGCNTLTANCATILIDPCLSILPIEKGGEILVYPNPFDGNLYFNLPYLNGIAEIQIVNNIGESIKTVTQIQNETVLNLASLSDGVYFILVRYNEQRVTKRLVKISK